MLYKAKAKAKAKARNAAHRYKPIRRFGEIILTVDVTGLSGPPEGLLTALFRGAYRCNIGNGGRRHFGWQNNHSLG